jgi:hypothetical protein
MRRKSILVLAMMILVFWVGQMDTSAGDWTTLDAPGTSNTYASGIDGDNIVGFYSDGIHHGFVYEVTESAIGGYIDWIDVAVFVDQWLEDGCLDANDWCGRADINRDENVDFFDFACLAQYWEDTAPVPGQASDHEPMNMWPPGVSRTADLSWTAGSDTAAHGVYFGTNPTPDANDFQGYQTATIFDPGLMIGITTYYWQVDEVGLGGETIGDIWSFTTAPEAGQARYPIPLDGSTIDGLPYPPDYIYVVLTFLPGDDAVSHEAFFSDDEAKVTARDPNVSLGAAPDPLEPTKYYAGVPLSNWTTHTDSLVRGTWYYWCVDETDSNDFVWPGAIWRFCVRLEKASNPRPVDGQGFVSLTPTLRWGAGAIAGNAPHTHEVYLGTDFNDVNNATEGGPLHRGSNAWDDLDWQPVADGGLSPLDPNTDYYWRIDEKHGTFAAVVIKGDVWSFTTHPVIQPPPLVGWWRFDLGEGSLALDWSGHGNNGMLVDGIDNGLAWAPAEGALNFDGSNNLSRVMIPASAITTTEGTIAIWANLTEPQIRDGGRNGSGYFFGCDHGVKNRILLYMDNSNTELDIRVGDHSENNIITLGTEVWYHIALTWNAGAYAVYVNGSQRGTGTYGGLSSLPSTADIGNNGSSSKQSFHGLMGDVQLYDKSLSVAEIQELYQDGAN